MIPVQWLLTIFESIHTQILFAQTHIWMYTHSQLSMYNMSMDMCTPGREFHSVCVCACMRACVHSFVCVCMCVRTCTGMVIHIHEK